MKPQPTAATIKFIPTPNGYEIPLICFEYDVTRQTGTFKLASRVVVGKARERRVALLKQKAAA